MHHQDVLCECAYKCHHLWIEKNFRKYRSIGQNTVCPKCGFIQIRSILTNVSSKITHVQKFRVPTFSQVRGRYNAYKFVEASYTDAIIDRLIALGFYIEQPDEYGILYEDVSSNFAYFDLSPRGKNKTLYLGFQNSSDPKISHIKDAVKEAIRIKKLEPSAPAQPKIESMKDSLGAEVHVGDWVAQWSTKSLTFGKIEKFGKTQDWKREKNVVARVRGMNGILSPLKTSNQILLLPPEKALLLALEK